MLLAFVEYATRPSPMLNEPDNGYERYAHNRNRPEVEAYDVKSRLWNIRVVHCFEGE